MDTNKITPRRPINELAHDICTRGFDIARSNGLDYDSDCRFTHCLKVEELNDIPGVVRIFQVERKVFTLLGEIQFHHFGMIKVTVHRHGEDFVTIMSENPASIFKVLFF